MKKNGWRAKVTPGSGDQGVDIIADKNSYRVVIQCKKYESSVGNKAVQEIYAGKRLKRADAACVVTNSSFTKSAMELAQALNVYLLHYSQLPNLDRIVSK